MTARLAATLWAALAIAAAAPLRAQSIPYAVTIDERPLDETHPVAREHDHVIFLNLVKAARALDGRLTFSSDATRVTIGAHSIVYRIGQPSADTESGRSIPLADAPFVEDGDIFVPADSIAKLAGATVAVDTRAHRVDLRTFRTAVSSSPAP